MIKNKYLLLVIVSLLFFVTKIHAQNNTVTTVNDKIEHILKKLSIKEKAGQLNLITIEGKITKSQLEQIRAGEVGSVLKSNGAAHNLRLQKVAVEESKSGIPILFQEDVIHGYKTITPIPLAESASWDMQAIRNSAAVAAREASSAGIQLTYAPMVDVCRDPRWGRIIEAAGEDPYLGSLVAAARVKGFQETGEKKYQNILACVKHFVGYGASLAGRDYNIQDFSERSLREVYLPPFQAAINAGVASLMCAYTAYDGVPLTANKFLLTNVLRKEMGFKGLVMTDYNTISNLIKIGVAPNDTVASLMAMNAGVDMDMVSKAFVNIIPYLIKSGKITEKQLDNAVRRVLLLKEKAGLLDDPYALLNEKREKKEILSKRNLATAKDMALRSIVLLKNDNHLLPLDIKSNKRIAIIGPFAKAKRDMLGWWACKGNPDDVTTIYEGLKAELGKKHEISYAKGCDIDSFKMVGASLIEDAVKTAKNADVVIMVLGEEYWMSGEGAGIASLHLPGLQEKLLSEVAKTGKPIITLMATGRPYILTDVAKNSNALLQVWMLGTTAGSAVADVVTGRFNPCGKLPVTFPYHEGQIPIFYSYRKTSHPFDAGPNDNRYSTTYRDVQSTPLYPFGYGLSYTSYKYGNMRLDNTSMTEKQTIKVSVDVTNTGKMEGREIVQLYIHDDLCSITRALKELKDFTILDLKPGETKTATFEITADKLSFIGRDYKKKIEKGEFTVFVGPNSNDLMKQHFKLN